MNSSAQGPVSDIASRLVHLHTRANDTELCVWVLMARNDDLSSVCSRLGHNFQVRASVS